MLATKLRLSRIFMFTAAIHAHQENFSFFHLEIPVSNLWIIIFQWVFIFFPYLFDLSSNYAKPCYLVQILLFFFGFLSWQYFNFTVINPIIRYTKPYCSMYCIINSKDSFGWVSANMTSLAYNYNSWLEMLISILRFCLLDVFSVSLIFSGLCLFYAMVYISVCNKLPRDTGQYINVKIKQICQQCFTPPVREHFNSVTDFKVGRLRKGITKTDFFEKNSWIKNN